jgi:[ribosomal protein S18]-alanine N-acetyltransferase
VILRSAAPADLPDVQRLEAALFGELAWSEHALAAELDQTTGDRLFLLAVEEESIVGYTIVVLLGAGADLLRIAVAAPVQRQGVATALLDAAISWSGERGAREMTLEVAETNRPAIALYSGAGFTQIAVRDRYYASGDDALVMGLVLSGAALDTSERQPWRP